MNKILFLLLALAAPFTVAQAQDAAAGAKKVSMCLGCHGLYRYQSSFPEVYKVPKISGQGAAFIVAALTEYKKGERKHPTMRAIATSLSDQDMADVAAYFEKSGEGASVKTVSAREPSAAVAALVAKGACTSCHGEGFNKPIAPSYPKIAGQYPDYLYAALKAYQTEGNPMIGRSNPIMGGIARQFTHAELKELANYVGSLPGDVKTVAEPEFR